VGKLQDDDGEGQERERETEADQTKEATKEQQPRQHKTLCEDLSKASGLLQND
jgi:hypothetical protein